MTTPDPLDDVTFLARSPHRVAVLETLADGPRTRPDLHGETGISQPTLGRVLGALEERHWVERRSGEYALTPWGELLAADFEDLLDTVESIQHLGEVAEYLPAETLGFDIQRLGSATVTTPEPGDILRHVRRGEELLGAATTIRLVTDTMVPASLEAQRDRLLADESLHLESVLTGEALDQALANREMVALIGDLLESGRAPVYRYEGDIPMPLLARADDTALLVPTDARGIPGALVESEDETVLEWVDEQFEAYRAESTELALEDLPE